MHDYRSSIVWLCIFFWATGAAAQATSAVHHDAASSSLQAQLLTAAPATGSSAAQTIAPTLADAALPPTWLALPFVILLLMIATGPLLYEKFWHKHYPKVALFLAGLVMAYYVLVLQDLLKPVEALAEYVQFMALISALYMASSGILIEVNQRTTPAMNLGLLLLGAVIANLIGTTGASMLLIRPYIRLNQARVKAYHIVFFIFMVSNVGGALTPIGDPPLFLGFLSGVPFFWTLQHHWLPWLVVLLLLGAIFYCLDTNNTQTTAQAPKVDPTQPALRLMGQHNFMALGLIIGAVFIDPNILGWVPAVHYGHHTFSCVRECILLSIAGASYYYADPQVLQKNEFSLEPLREVACIFIGIFGTMIPALALISAFAGSEAGRHLITPHTLYWGTGTFSSILDNAPTYLTFLAASMAAQGADVGVLTEVQQFAAGNSSPHTILQLKAIALASVCFGAMTYIGNGPNFMVKAIAEQLGVRMPSFFAYILRFAVPFLLPALVLVWLLFFCFH